MLFFFIYIFWLIRSALQIFFWLYLWQLKQYHTGRFLDHFKTTNGKKLIFHPLQWGKVVFALISPYFLLVAYITEPFLRARRFPSWTKKTIFLALISVLFYTVLPIFAESIWLLVLADLFLPICVSLIVLIFQPLSYLFRSSLQKKAGKKREELDLKVVAITGSYAKTSTKEYLSTILSYRFNVSSTKEHQNTEVAIPRAILNLDKSCDIFIAELGAYDKGTIKRICRFLKPQIGIVTGINEQHLSLFGSMENLLSAEGGQELLDCLPEDGMLVCNIENGYGADLLQAAKIKKIPYSYADLKELTVNADKVSFKYDGQEFNCDVLGKHNALNLLGAIKVAKELGMSNEEILRGIRKIHSSTKVIKGKYNIIDSSYSANPTGVMADIDVLGLFPGKKAVIMPCLIELGRASASVHKNIGEKIDKDCQLGIITTKEFFEQVKGDSNKIFFLSDPDEILRKIESTLSKGDSILIEGRINKEIASKIHEANLNIIKP